MSSFQMVVAAFCFDHFKTGPKSFLLSCTLLRQRKMFLLLFNILNGLVLGYSVPAKIDHSGAGHSNFREVTVM
jgi:hypothetical protein